MPAARSSGGAAGGGEMREAATRVWRSAQSPARGRCERTRARFRLDCPFRSDYFVLLLDERRFQEIISTYRARARESIGPGYSDEQVWASMDGSAGCGCAGRPGDAGDTAPASPSCGLRRSEERSRLQVCCCADKAGVELRKSDGEGGCMHRRGEPGDQVWH